MMGELLKYERIELDIVKSMRGLFSCTQDLQSWGAGLASVDTVV